MKISKKEVLKFFIFRTIMGIPKVNIRINIFLFSLLIQGKYEKYLISFTISSLKCFLHLQDTYLEGMTHDTHGDHLAKGDVHLSFPLRQHLVDVKDFN
jgi:hypothetical protein